MKLPQNYSPRISANELPPLQKGPVVTVEDYDDPTQIGPAIQILKQDVITLDSHPLKVRRISIRLRSMIIVAHYTNVAVRVRAEVAQNLIAYTTFGPNASGSLNGLSLSPSLLLASPAGREVELVVAAGYESIAIFLPPEEMRSQLHGRGLQDLFCFPTLPTFLKPDAGALYDLYKYESKLVDIASTNSELFEIPAAQTAAQIDLTEKLITALMSSVETHPTRRELTQQAHSRIVQMAEDFALSNPGEQFYVRDLCEATGVCERTLQMAFKAILGMTPIAFLTRLRLHRVREALRSQSHQSTSVTAEALRFGFWHLGDFSAAYKECFGELPSETLG